MTLITNNIFNTGRIENVSAVAGYFEKVYNTALNLKDNAVHWYGTTSTDGNRLNLYQQLQQQVQGLNSNIGFMINTMGLNDLPPVNISY